MKKLLLLVLIFTSTITYGAGLGLDNLSQDEVDQVTEELAANFMHTSVTHAGSLGDIFGFEVGIMLGLAESSSIEKLAKETDSSKDIGHIPHGGILGMVSVPYGITGEISFVPEVDTDEFDFDNMTFGLKWTFSDVLFKLPIPLDLAIKGHYSKNSISYSDTVDSINTTVAFDTDSYGFMLMGSLSIPIIKPYAGIGFVSSDSDVTLTGNASIFDFTTSSSASSSHSGAHLLVGANLDLAFFHLGLEYSNIYGISRYTGKMTFGF